MRLGEKSVIEPKLFKMYGLLSVSVTCRERKRMMEFATITNWKQAGLSHV